MDEFRTKGGTKAAIVGIGSNTFLTIFNIGIGIISGSYALISEGAHTLSDVATSIIAYLGFRIGQNLLMKNILWDMAVLKLLPDL